MAPSTHQARQAGYFERLRTPWWWYLGAVAVSLLLGLEFAVAVSGWVALVPFAILLPASLLVVGRLSSGSLALDGSTLRAGARSVALADIERAIDLSAAELRRLVGRHGDPLAFTYIRSWIGPGVQLVLRPPADREPAQPARARSEQVGSEQAGSELVPSELAPPESAERYPEPYWVVSTRHPDRLLAALHAAVPATRSSRPPAG
ncbi:MAG TPA: DUF3093 domain-containing protein [Jatrophihabitans sp.]|jgi:hypothetical protein|nr:DUF3093 domain-containing protein [Jatrophihabitans sp.]